jgi:hypothetical protein
MPEQSEDHRYADNHFYVLLARERLKEAQRERAKRRSGMSIPQLIRDSCWDSLHWETREKIKNRIGFIVALMLILILMQWMGISAHDDYGDFCDTRRCSRD